MSLGLRKFWMEIKEREGPMAVIPALQAAKFPYVHYRPEFQRNWDVLHDWCRLKFGDGNYMWSFDHFFFDSEDHARYFKIYWVWQLTHALTAARDTGMAYAIRFSDEENFKKEKQFLEDLNTQAHAQVDYRNIHLARWCLLPDDETLVVYGRLLAGNGEVVDLREYDLD